MKPTSVMRKALTLIELLIAVSIGIMVIVVAITGLRVTSQAVIKCNRMAMENTLVRTAVLQACDEVDFWTLVDDPEMGLTPLRTPGRFGEGRPFTPFTTSGGPLLPAFSSSGAERESTWNPSPMAWAAFDPRTWCRGNMAETINTDLRFGDYRLIANDLTPAAAAPYDPSRCRSWYDHQIKSAFDALGFYGAQEYLPSSAIYLYHGADPKVANPTSASPGGVPRALLTSGRWFGRTFQGFSVGRFRTADAGCIPFANGKNIFSQSNVTSDPFRSTWLVGYGGNALGGGTRAGNEQVNFHLATEFGGDLLTERPFHWPQVSVKVERFIRQSRAISICVIEIIDPMTGQKTTIPFSTRGTSLRGARLQRTAVGSEKWSTYDNSDPARPVIGASLDSPAITY